MGSITLAGSDSVNYAGGNGTLIGITVTTNDNLIALSSIDWEGQCLSGACNDRLSLNSTLNSTILNGVMIGKASS